MRAQQAGVTKIVLACCDETEFPQIIRLCDRYPGMLFPSIGIHPENMAQDIDAQLAATRKLLDSYISEAGANGKRPLAIGEIGIDLHWDKTRFDDQLIVLAEQLDWALQYDLPVLLHIRDAMQEFLDFFKLYLLKRAKADYPTWADIPRMRGILHCYSGNVQEARQALDLADFMIGVGGTLTYKKSQVPDIVRAIGIEHVVLETDAPYLAPVPHRGKRNEPAYTADTARFLSELLDMPIDEVADITSHNAERLLGF